jgi:hypothetical protein
MKYYFDCITYYDILFFTAYKFLLLVMYHNYNFMSNIIKNHKYYILYIIYF